MEYFDSHAHYNDARFADEYPGGADAAIHEVGCHVLVQGIFPTQGLNLGLLYCNQILYHLSHLLLLMLLSRFSHVQLCATP